MKLLITGHKGMVGASLVKAATAEGKWDVKVFDRQAVDLTHQQTVFDALADLVPDVVIVAAAKVGGIMANATYPADFLYDNLAIAANVIEGSRRARVPRLLFLGSSCIYPKNAPQPMREDCLLTSPLEPTNEAYAIAKIAGLKMCQHYRTQHGLIYHSAMPTNLYGPGDNYHPQNSHVIPALMRRFHEAAQRGDEEVVIWGTGTPRREFLHVDDLAQACLHLLKAESPPDWVNVGVGEDVSILEVATMLAEITGFNGRILTDASKPDGTPRKLLDVAKLKSMGWTASIPLRDGLETTYREFLKELTSRNARL